jgi:hypothetical protein
MPRPDARETGAVPSERLERAILGTLLEKPSRAEDLDGLREEDFALSSHAAIFSQVRAMVEAGETVDISLLASRLEAEGKLESVGGIDYISGLVDGVVHQCFDPCVRVLKKSAHRRRLTRALERAVSRAADFSVKTEDIVSELERLSAAYRDGDAAVRKIRFRTAAELAAETPEEVTWVARPWVAAGAITLAVGKVKAAGKTTFFTHLVKAVLDGVPFMGASTTKGPVMYLTEQSSLTFKVALQRAGLLERQDLRILTWAEASGLAWPDLMCLARRECKRIGAVLLVVDTLGQFTGLVGDTENNAGDALRAMQPLQQATGEGLGVLASQHERKSGGEVEDSGRGSSAFSGASDIVLNFRRPPGQNHPNVRVIRALSRYNDPPPESVIELTSDGYVPLDHSHVNQENTKAAILAATPKSESSAAVLKDICQCAGVQRTIGQDVVNKLLARGELRKLGRGVKGDPYRYWTLDIHSAGNPSYIRQKESF